MKHVRKITPQKVSAPTSNDKRATDKQVRNPQNLEVKDRQDVKIGGCPVLNIR